jgi:hypothetical protein
MPTVSSGNETSRICKLENEENVQNIGGMDLGGRGGGGHASDEKKAFSLDSVYCPFFGRRASSTSLLGNVTSTDYRMEMAASLRGTELSKNITAETFFFLV